MELILLLSQKNGSLPEPQKHFDMTLGSYTCFSFDAKSLGGVCSSQILHSSSLLWVICKWFPGTQCSQTARTFCTENLNTGKLIPNSNRKRVTTYFLFIVLIQINLVKILNCKYQPGRPLENYPHLSRLMFQPSVLLYCRDAIKKIHFSMTCSNVQCFQVFVLL